MTVPGAGRGVGAVLALALAACGGGDGRDATRAERGDQPAHVWQPQVDAYRKAQNVEGVILDAAARRREGIDGQAP